MITRSCAQFIIIMCILCFAPLSSSAPITSLRDESLRGSAIINFDNFTENVYLSNFSVGPVNFHNEIQYGGNYFVSNAFLPGESGRHIGLYGQGYITFDNAMSSFAFMFGALNSSWHIEALNSSGEVIESIDLINPSCCGSNVYGITADDIWGIRLYSESTTLDAAVMDNFHYVSAVPIYP